MEEKYDALRVARSENVPPLDNIKNFETFVENWDKNNCRDDFERGHGDDVEELEDEDGACILGVNDDEKIVISNGRKSSKITRVDYTPIKYNYPSKIRIAIYLIGKFFRQTKRFVIKKFRGGY